MIKTASKTLLVLVFIARTSFFPAQAQNANEYPSYIIQSGDSLGYIADLFDTSVEEIITLNNIEDADFISPGDSIFIPSYPGLTGNLNIISTKLGETYDYLSVKYNIDDSLLQKLNSLLSPTLIFPGTELILLQPDGFEPLIPATLVGLNDTLLETSARLSANPQVLLLQNRYVGRDLLLPGEVVFTKASATFSSLNLFFPSLQQISISPLPLVQGATQVISVSNDLPVKLTGSLAGQQLNFFDVGNGEFYALQGIYALQEPGLVDFTISATYEDGTTDTHTQSILVTPGNFDVDPPLKVDPATIDPAVTGPENNLVYSLVSTLTPIRYWYSPFISPAYYQEYNSLYGTRRQYNDDPELYFHTGVDFAGGMTLPIIAPAAGEVVFAGPLTVRGNAVFIDHGWGVFSGFFHQDTLLVSKGDSVEAGQQIGTVGNTGRVNGAGDYLGAGAHLHWELWVNGIQVNPLDWLINQYP